jgi:hypothetical protein
MKIHSGRFRFIRCRRGKDIRQQDCTTSNSFKTLQSCYIIFQMGNHKKQKNSPCLTCRGYMPSIFEMLRELLKIESSDKCKISQEWEGLYHGRFLLTKTIDFTLKLEITRHLYLLSLYIRSTGSDYNGM